MPSNVNWKNIAPVVLLKCDLEFSFDGNSRKFMCLILSSTAEGALVNQSFWCQDCAVLLEGWKHRLWYDKKRCL